VVISCAINFWITSFFIQSTYCHQSEIGIELDINNNEIALPEIAKGVYILEVRNGEEVLRKRIVKK
jgi:hypothetical protein